MVESTFRPARPDETELLDEITLAGIRHSGHHVDHPEAYAGLQQLLEARDGTGENVVRVLEEAGRVIGFIELVKQEDHVELLRMFIQPDRIGSGIGRVLWDEATKEAATLSDRMLIMADPAAIGFYEAMGAETEHHVEVAPNFRLARMWFDLGRD